MKKILIGGAGGAPSEGVIRSLLLSPEHEEIIGMGSVSSDLALSHAARKYVVPYADTPAYREALIKLLKAEKPDLIHFQNDLEIYHASLLRDEIMDAGTTLFMPGHKVIETCVSKWRSWQAFKRAGLTVPENIYIKDEDSLRKAFHELGDEEGRIWLRADSMGGGGMGSIPTNDYAMARAWIDRYEGWGKFIAAELLGSSTVTFLSLWYRGELVVGQSRKRNGWIHGNRTVSGVTGVTRMGETCSNDEVTRTALQAVRAVDPHPHGIYGVDMAYDKKGNPNPTEINISRFFTTVLFFTEAGLNMPVIYKDLALYGRKPVLDKKINPLQDGLVWLRGMDTEPVLSTVDKMREGLILL